MDGLTIVVGPFFIGKIKENIMENYIGNKLIKAKQMNKYEFYMNIKGVDCKEDNEDGYLVEYQSGYQSWCPTKEFEKAHIKVGDNNTITPENVDQFVKQFEVSMLGDKTTVVKAELVNGFIIVESSSCVDPKNFDMTVGIEICKDRIQNKIWELLGFLLQTAVKGVK